ncbi:MAG: membrane integrity-associated transporter subunit PqiC [Deltaproteobacteria bacterium]|nr:membrane integrity-associated transporter subunit PqiC [Deltaproteobacteria bacterium]MBW2390203.1 membrane integrity-associated transporter subunit PqiC [Deltaproteobacteria bacterium]
MPQSAAIGVAVLTALMAIGCLGGSPAVEYYTFETVAGLADDAASEAGPELAVSVGPVHLPGYLDRQQIATRPGGSRVRYDEFHRWAGVLDSEIPRALADNLRILLASNRIVAYPTTAPFALDYRVVIEIERFDAALAGDAVLQARWSILSDSGGDALAVERSDLKGQVGSSGYSDLAVAHSELLADLSRSVAAKLREVDRAQREVEDPEETAAP